MVQKSLKLLKMKTIKLPIKEYLGWPTIVIVAPFALNLLFAIIGEMGLKSSRGPSVETVITNFKSNVPTVMSWVSILVVILISIFIMSHWLKWCFTPTPAIKPKLNETD